MTLTLRVKLKRRVLENQPNLHRRGEGTTHFSLVMDSKLCRHSSLKGAVTFDAIVVERW